MPKFKHTSIALPKPLADTGTIPRTIIEIRRPILVIVQHKGDFFNGLLSRKDGRVSVVEILEAARERFSLLVKAV